MSEPDDQPEVAPAILHMQSPSFLARQTASTRGRGTSKGQTLFQMAGIPTANGIRSLLAPLPPCRSHRELLLHAGGCIAGLGRYDARDEMPAATSTKMPARDEKGTDNMLDIHLFPCLSDNYGVLIHDTVSGAVASVDAPDAAAIGQELAAKGWKLTHILTTHHHADHTQGNSALKSATGCTIIGPKGEAAKVAGLDEAVGEGDTFRFGSIETKVLETGGHTSGHVSYWMPAAKVAFVGDTLFAMGCGRVFEGTPRQMWRSLQKLMALPGDTTIYCGHEYTLSNARFALTIEPDSATLQARVAEVERLRTAGRPTVPTRIDVELSTNPFLRPHVPAIRERLGMAGKEDWEVFAEIRERKNRG